MKITIGQLKQVISEATKSQIKLTPSQKEFWSVPETIGWMEAINELPKKLVDAAYRLFEELGEDWGLVPDEYDSEEMDPEEITEYMDDSVESTFEFHRDQTTGDFIMSTMDGPLSQWHYDPATDAWVKAAATKTTQKKPPAKTKLTSWESEFTMYTREEAERNFPEAFETFAEEIGADTKCVFFNWPGCCGYHDLAVVDIDNTDLPAMNWSPDYGWGEVERDSMDRSSRMGVVKIAKKLGML